MKCKNIFLQSQCFLYLNAKIKHNWLHTHDRNRLHFKSDMEGNEDFYCDTLGTMKRQTFWARHCPYTVCPDISYELRFFYICTKQISAGIKTFEESVHLFMQCVKNLLFQRCFINIQFRMYKTQMCEQNTINIWYFSYLVLFMIEGRMERELDRSVLRLQ